jgi:hypothetical protein
VSDLHGDPVPRALLYSPSGVFQVWVSPESVILNEYENLAPPDGPVASTADWWQFEYPNPGRLPPDRTRFCMQRGGDLTLRTSKGKLIWHSRTAGTGHHNYLRVQDNGNLVVRTGKGRIVWASWTTRTIRPDGFTLGSGRHLVYRYRQQFGITPTWLKMRPDGDLVLLLGRQVIWRTGTHVKGAYARLLPRGDFVVMTPSGTILWRSGTHGRPSYLELVTGCLTFNTNYGKVWARPRACGP